MASASQPPSSNLQHECTCLVQCSARVQTRGGGCGQAVCKGPHVHGGGDRGRGVCHRSLVVRSLTGRLHSHTLTPRDSSNPSPHPTVRKDNVPWSGGPPGTPGRRRLCVPIGWPAGSVEGGAASTRKLCHSMDMRRGPGRGLQPRALRGPRRCAQHSGGRLGAACTRMCAAVGMQGSTAWATLLPGPCSLHSVPGRPGTGMHEGLGEGCPCWEVMRGAGATCS